MDTALARTRWSPHSGFLLIVLRDTKQLYFHFIGLFSETISGQRCTVLDLKKKKKRKLGYSYGLNCRDKQRCAVKWLFWEKPIGGFPLSRNFYVRRDLNFNWLYVRKLK